MMEKHNGYIFILIGPSASGKTSLLKGITEGFYTLPSGEKRDLPGCCKGLSKAVKKVITATTRKPRTGEINGIHYRFLNKSEFGAERVRGNIIEETLYAGASYGILASEINKIFEENLSGIIVLDKHGVSELKRIFGDERVVGIFIYRELEKIREELKKRTKDMEEVESRLKIAVEELKMSKDFDFTIYNTGTMEDSLKELCQIICEKRGC